MSLFSGISSVMLPVAQVLNFGVRIFDTGVQTRETIQKLETYDRKKWDVRDYGQVVARVAYIWSNLLRIKYDVALYKAQLSIDNSHHISYEKCLKEGDIQHLKQKIVECEIVNCLSYFGLQKLSGQDVMKVLCGPDGLKRFAALAALGDDDVRRAVGLLLDGGSTCQRLGILPRDLRDLLRNVNLVSLGQQLYQYFLMPQEQYIPVLLDNEQGNEDLILPKGPNYETIPQEYEKNHIFSQYVCPITGMSIRCPVKVTSFGVDHYFERGAIQPWVLQKKTHPLTRRPLYNKNLRIDSAVLRIIQNEMVRLGIQLT